MTLKPQGKRPGLSFIRRATSPQTRQCPPCAFVLYVCWNSVLGILCGFLPPSPRAEDDRSPV